MKKNKFPYQIGEIKQKRGCEWIWNGDAWIDYIPMTLEQAFNIVQNELQNHTSDIYKMVKVMGGLEEPPNFIY